MTTRYTLEKRPEVLSLVADAEDLQLDAGSSVPNAAISSSRATTGLGIFTQVEGHQNVDAVRMTGNPSASGQFLRVGIPIPGNKIIGTGSNIMIRLHLPAADVNDVQQQMSFRVMAQNGTSIALNANHALASNILNNAPKKRYETIVLNTADFTQQGSGMDWDAPVGKIFVMWRASSTPPSVADVYIDGVFTNWRWPNGEIPITFTGDDGNRTQYDVLFKQYFEPEGWPASLAIISGLLDEGGNTITSAELREMVAAGWTHMNHGNDAAVWTGLSQAALTAKLQLHIDEMRQKGFNSLERQMAVYPTGAVDENVLTTLADSGFLRGRTVRPGHITFEQRFNDHGIFEPGGPDPFVMRSCNMGVGGSNFSNWAEMETVIDACIQKQMPVNFHFHNFTDTPVAGTDFGIDQLPLLVAGIKSKAARVVGIENFLVPDNITRMAADSRVTRWN
ncbi:MAG: polysaccharide deacetylase family protein [Pseudomonadota bacterium]